MTRYVAFLRAVNVGGRRVTMDALRAEFERLGFDEVTTYIASGNVLFGTSGRRPGDLEATIESRLAGALGFEVATFVRTAAQVRKVVELDPFPDRDAAHTYLVAFLKRKPAAAARRAIEALSGDVDTLRVDGAELHWLIRGKSMDSRIKPRAMEQAAGGGGPATSRNITMLRKLAAKLDP